MDALKSRLQLFFGVVLLFSATILLMNWYQDYRFNHSPLPQAMQDRIVLKKESIMRSIQQHYGFVFDVPILVTDKMNSKMYGLTAFDGKNITVYLNKKRMKESFSYMVESVIAHEYAHALMFKTGAYRHASDGHGEQWKVMCKRLGGKNCARYVDEVDVINGKLLF